MTDMGHRHHMCIHTPLLSLGPHIVTTIESHETDGASVQLHNWNVEYSSTIPL
jgi:hypothetical protein